MKKIISTTCFFLLVFLTIIAVPAGGSADTPWNRKLPFKELTIHYTVSGMENGTETLFIQDYGQRRALVHEGTTSIMGFSSRNRRLEITDPNWHYTFDLEKQTGSKTVNPGKIYQEEFNKLSAAEKKNVLKNSKELGNSMLRNFSGETVKNAATILGYNCDRTTVMGTTVYLIHNTDIMLRREMNMMGMQGKTEATSIDKGKVPPAAFALPAGIAPVRDEAAEAMTKQMVQNIINTLKEPDGAEKMRSRTRQNSMMEMPPRGEPATAPRGRRREGPGQMPDKLQQGMKMIQGLFGR
ncbi:MAG TPA: hypothetical protein ENG91_02185 [Desulfobacteraceae bacterium]|nr:hypothetical protein [Desulfobacteraceae bacterium]HDO30938.1 hypothetical protein [Desulfobacteraceae bacterium]